MEYGSWAGKCSWEMSLQQTVASVLALSDSLSFVKPTAMLWAFLDSLWRIPIPTSHATKASNSCVSEFQSRFSNLTLLPFTTMPWALWTFQLDSEAPSKAVPGFLTHRNCEMISAFRFGIQQWIAKSVAKPRTAMDLRKTWPVCLRLEFVLFLKNRLSVNMDTRIHVFPFVSKSFHFYPPTAA